MADAMVLGLRTTDHRLRSSGLRSWVHEWRPPEPAYKLCTNMFSEMFNSLSLTNADHVVFNTVQSTFLQIIAQIWPLDWWTVSNGTRKHRHSLHTRRHFFFLVFPRLFTLGAALLIVIAVWLSDMPCSEILNYTARKVLLEDRQAA